MLHHTVVTTDLTKYGDLRDLEMKVTVNKMKMCFNYMKIMNLRIKIKVYFIYLASLGPNAISVSLSPRNNYVMIGLASKRVFYVITPTLMVAQVYKLVKKKAGEKSMEVSYMSVLCLIFFMPSYSRGHKKGTTVIFIYHNFLCNCIKYLFYCIFQKI